MKKDNSTKQSNASKLMLAVALLFRIRKLKNYQKTVFGFENRFFRILKNTKKDYYFYGFYDFTSQNYRQLHKGIKLPITGFQITVWTIIFNVFWIPFIIITFIPYLYFDGAKNFIIDSAWYQNVRLFNWINFIGLIILVSVMLFKSYC